MLKRTKKSKDDLINAEEGEDHFTDISSVGEDDNLRHSICHYTASLHTLQPLNCVNIVLYVEGNTQTACSHCG